MGLGRRPLSFAPPPPLLCIRFSFLTADYKLWAQGPPGIPFRHLGEHAAAAGKRVSNEPIPVFIPVQQIVPGARPIGGWRVSETPNPGGLAQMRALYTLLLPFN